MLIDWPTVIFQIINFLILIALLKRFLYGPILRAMEEREKTIAQRLEQAARAENEAKKHASRLAAEQEEFARSRSHMQQEARVEIEKWKNESINRLKNDIDLQKKNWQKSLEEEQEAFLHKLKITISQQVFQVAKKAFTDLANEQLEIQLIDTFLEKINPELSSIETPKTSHDSVLIVSGFPLKQGEKNRLKKGLSPFFPDLDTFHFHDESELGFGLRLHAGNHKWEWNISRYMHDIENEILKTMGMAK